MAMLVVRRTSGSKHVAQRSPQSELGHSDQQGQGEKEKQDKGNLPTERLAHKSCNTGKGSNAPVVPWPDHLIVVDPAPIIAAAERLERKGGREAMARCPTRQDADAVAEWLVDRLSRLSPGLEVKTEIASTGGQHLVSLRAS
ncbi:hypothetical protein FHS27_001299 [Rhodopirellula rubra]|uniref:Uncharacterized protein n=1 Tax=Aporhodopirellula rubra TaxID=980271 RepID=A0A7W5DVV4_9BACT|nr:hypothetical protein [Aporhodopirellula rubra]MBB3205499.1 hypothetical protein [Aporhodopirellula rubra]